jgi:hypothetical protein
MINLQKENPMHRRAFLAAMATMVAAAGEPALAQSARGPNGGLVAKVDGHTVELVSKDLDVRFYFNEPNGTPMPMKGAHGRAVVQDAGKTHTVTLAPAEPNALVGKLQSPLGAKARVVLSMTGHDHPLQVRFVTD